MLSDQTIKQTLEEITHPLVRNRLRQLQQTALDTVGYFILENALLFETGGDKQVDYIVTVACSKQNQLDRLCQRHSIETAEAEQWINSQMPIDSKVQSSDVVIWNDSSLEHLMTAAIDALDEIKSQILASSNTP